MWKWGVVVLLIACAVWLFFWKPSPRPVKVELLPFTDSPPAWNGSYPFLTISMTGPDSDHVRFDGSILLLKPTVHHDSPVNLFQVDLHTGAFVLRQTDLFVPDITPLALTRTYRVWNLHSRAFGVGANHPYDICPTSTRNPYTYMDLNLEDGRQIHFRRISKGTDFADDVLRHEDTSSEFYGAQIAWNGNGWTLKFKDGSAFTFPEAYHAKNFAQGAAFEMRDAGGHRIQLKRSNVRNLEQLISPSGRTLTFKYDAADRIVEAADDAGNVRKYSYDSTGHLETVSDATRLLFRFEYMRLTDVKDYDPYVMATVFDGRDKVLLQNIYDSGGRVREQKLANGEAYRYQYLFDSKTAEISETIVNDAAGQKKFYFWNGIFKAEQ